MGACYAKLYESAIGCAKEGEIMTTDEDLYRRCFGSDEDALRELLERHREGLTLFLAGIVGNMEDAEELAMDTFAVMLANKNPFAGRSSFRTWLFAIGRNLALIFLRKHRNHILPIEEISHLVHEEHTELQLIRSEDREHLYEALFAIHENYRQALFLTYFEGMSVREAAHIMGRTERQVSDYLYRGKAALKTVMERRGFQYLT